MGAGAYLCKSRCVFGTAHDRDSAGLGSLPGAEEAQASGAPLIMVPSSIFSEALTGWRCFARYVSEGSITAPAGLELEHNAFVSLPRYPVVGYRCD